MPLITGHTTYVWVMWTGRPCIPVCTVYTYGKKHCRATLFPYRPYARGVITGRVEFGQSKLRLQIIRICLKTADHRRTPQTTTDHFMNARKAADRRPPQDCQENCRTHGIEHGGTGSKTAEEQCMCIFRQINIACRLHPNHIET